GSSATGCGDGAAGLTAASLRPLSHRASLANMYPLRVADARRNKRTGLRPTPEKLLATRVSHSNWLRGTDLNRRPRGYEPRELPLLHPATHPRKAPPQVHAPPRKA